MNYRLERLMWYPRDKTPVHRIVIVHDGERLDFPQPWIAADQAAMTVHAWTHRESPRPAASVPLMRAQIEWCAPIPAGLE